MRRTHRTVSGLTALCACQFGPSAHCRHDRHGQCGRATPLADVETFICGPDGETVLTFLEPFEHPTDTATGPYRTYTAQVWLADRVCRWVCSCDCHTAAAVPVAVQDALFEVAA